MSDEMILKMLEDIINHVDYDIAKSIFNDDLSEDPELSAETREELIRIVKKYTI